MKWLIAKWASFNVPSLLINVLLTTLLAMWAYSCGLHYERAKWQAKENAELVKKQAEIIDLTNRNRALENQANLDAQARDEKTTQELQHAKDREIKLINDVRSGTLRLSVATKALRTYQSASRTTAAREQVGDTETRAELSDSFAEDILALGSDADQVTIERNALADEVLSCRAQYESLANMIGGGNDR